MEPVPSGNPNEVLWNTNTTTKVPKIRTKGTNIWNMATRTMNTIIMGSTKNMKAMITMPTMGT